MSGVLAAVFLVAGAWFAALCLLADLDAGKAWERARQAEKGSSIREARENVAQQADDRARHLLWIAVALWAIGFGLGTVAW